MSDDDLLLSVTPGADDVARYADASGDRNPIHLDDAFARGVGLPGVVVHGLWTLAQAARAATLRAGGDPRALRELRADFRAPGVPGAPIDVVLTGVGDDGALGLAVRQGHRRLVRRATAVVSNQDHQDPPGGPRVAAPSPERRA